MKKSLPTTEEKEDEKKKEVVKVDGEKAVTVEEIKEGWDKFVDEIKPFNHHLYAFIGGGHIRSFEGGTLHLEVPFSFHKDRIETPKSRNIISEVFGKVYSAPCKVECYVNPDIKPVEKADADIVLKNLPVIPKKKETEEKPKKATASDIEAIFEGV